MIFRSTKDSNAAMNCLAFLLAALLVLPGNAKADRLYLLSGTPTNGQSVPVNLYSVDPDTSGPVTLVSNVTEGLSCVLVDYQQRILVVASPDIKPTDFFVINMNVPAVAKVRHIANDGANASMTVGNIFLIKTPQQGTGVGLVLDKVTPESTVKFASSLTFAGLSASGPAISVPFDALSNIRFSGFAGGSIVEGQCEVALRGDPLRVLLGANAGSLAISRPPYLRQRDPNDSYMLISNDDRKTIIRPLQPPDPGVIDVLDRKSNEWHRVPMPFSSATMRTFGHWLAGTEIHEAGTAAQTKGATTLRRTELESLKESPGAVKRRSEEIAPGFRREPATTVDDLFQMAQFRGDVFTGELLIHNLDTGAQLRISTGSGDSEVLFADDDAVYYRVDDALYRRAITGSSLGDPVKLAEGEEIVQVHWAFLN